MTLAEFVKKRREELGVTWNDVIDAGVSHNTFSKIINGKQLTMQPVTMEKLARVLKCTIGELQACMAETPNPLRKEAEKPEGNAGISITAGAGKTKKKTAPAPDPEEPAEVFQEDDEDEQEEMAFPVYHSVYEEDRKEGEERYKQKLRDMCLRIFASGIPGVHTMEKIYADIGYAIVKELAQGGDNE